MGVKSTIVHSHMNYAESTYWAWRWGPSNNCGRQYQNLTIIGILKDFPLCVAGGSDNEAKVYMDYV